MTQITKIISLNFVLFFAIQASLFANLVNPPNQDPPVIRTNWGNSMREYTPPIFPFSNDPSVCIEILDDNLLNIYIDVLFSNNNIQQYPDIYLYYNFGDNLLENMLKIMPSDLSLVSGADGRLYVATYAVTVDVSSYYNAEQDLVSFPYCISLRKSKNELYPISEYYGSGQLFDTNVFAHNISPELCNSKKLCWTKKSNRNESNLNENITFKQNNLTEQVPTIIFSDNISTDHKKSLTSFPNPFSDFITITLPIGWNEELVISDISGKIVWRKKLHYFVEKENTLNISTSHWQTGFYTINLITNDKKVYQKIVKNNF